MAWLVTGGAGGVGSRVVAQLRRTSREVVVLDDLSSGRAERLPAGVRLVKGSVGDRRAVRRALGGRETITGVVHLAVHTHVAESVRRPLYYWSQNVGGLQVLLEEMVAAGIEQLVCSSSAEVYGHPAGLRAGDRIKEATPCAPANPFGASALAAEWMLAATARAHGWRALSLRTPFVVGAAGAHRDAASSADPIPRVLHALSQGQRPQVFGDDYPTPDGSLVRDYLHIADLAAAHVAAVRAVEVAHAGGSSTSVRTAGDLVQHAATRLRGARAVEVAGQVPGAAETVAEVAGQAAARAMGQLPAAAWAVELATQKTRDALRAANASGAMAEVASQLGSLAAKVTGTDGPRLVDHLAVNLSSGRGHSTFEVIEALREATGEQFAVDIVARHLDEPASLVLDPGLAGQLLGWRARRGLSDMAGAAWEAWQQPE